MAMTVADILAPILGLYLCPLLAPWIGPAVPHVLVRYLWCTLDWTSYLKSPVILVVLRICASIQCFLQHRHIPSLPMNCHLCLLLQLNNRTASSGGGFFSRPPSRFLPSPQQREPMAQMKAQVVVSIVWVAVENDIVFFTLEAFSRGLSPHFLCCSRSRSRSLGEVLLAVLLQW